MTDTGYSAEAGAPPIPPPLRTPSPRLVREMAARIPPAPPGVRSPPAVIAAVAAQIAERFHPAQIVLFGSRAYGRPTPESDIDLMVVMDTDQSLFTQAVAIGHTVDLRPPFPWLDVKVRTPAQIRLGLKEHDFFIQDVMLKGITLYERGDVTIPGDDEECIEEPNELKQATRDFLRMAADDAGGAIRMLGDQPPYPHLACFLAQQSVEKTVKALLQEREIEFPRTHNLVALAALARSIVPELSADQAALKELTACAVEARYKVDAVSIPAAEAAIRTMTAVREIILAALEVATA